MAARFRLTITASDREYARIERKEWQSNAATPERALTEGLKHAHRVYPWADLHSVDIRWGWEADRRPLGRR